MSRQRDEHIARENTVHFQARTIHESVERHARVAEVTHARDWNDPSAKLSREEKEMRGIETGMSFVGGGQCACRTIIYQWVILSSTCKWYIFVHDGIE